jgi:hypothetical protein
MHAGVMQGCGGLHAPHCNASHASMRLLPPSGLPVLPGSMDAAVLAGSPPPAAPPASRPPPLILLCAAASQPDGTQASQTLAENENQYSTKKNLQQQHMDASRHTKIGGWRASAAARAHALGWRLGQAAMSGCWGWSCMLASRQAGHSKRRLAHAARGSAFLAPSMALATEANTSSMDRVPSICSHSGQYVQQQEGRGLARELIVDWFWLACCGAWGLLGTGWHGAEQAGWAAGEQAPQGSLPAQQAPRLPLLPLPPNPSSPPPAGPCSSR